MRFTLKESYPFLTDKERLNFGLLLSEYGVKRTGRKIKEGDYSVNIYEDSNKKIIEDLFRKFAGS